MKNFDVIAPELDRLIHDRFTGSLTLHCTEGQVLKYEVSATMKPGRNGTEAVDLVEATVATRGPLAEVTPLEPWPVKQTASDRRGLRK